MRRVYTLLVWLALPLATLAVAWRGVRQRDYWRGWAQRFGFGAHAPRGSQRCIWIHAVSMGEVQAAQPLLSALQAQGWSPLFTSATPTGRNRAAQLCGPTGQAVYAPYDLPGFVARLIRSAQPRLLIVIETELWPNTLHACARAGVPVLIASARLSVRTAAGLARWPGLLSAAALANLHVAAQTGADALRYLQLGLAASAVRVCGNLKFDRQAVPAALAQGRVLRESIAPGRPLWVAGSTHAGEEEAVLAAHRAVIARPGLERSLLVLAPRHPQRFDEVATRLRGAGWRFQRRSDGRAPGDDDPVLLLDTMGELADIYAAADLAFVGGSLVSVGGHNLLEPASLGVAMITGPGHRTAPEVYATLRGAEAVVEVGDAAAITEAAARLLLAPAARQRLAAAATRVLEANRGCRDRLLAWIGELA